MRSWIIRLGAIVGVLSLSLGLVAACAPAPGGEKPEQFYQGKTITWIVASGAASGTTLVSRIIAPFLGAELGATVRVENMGTNEGMNWVYTQGSKDGLTMLSKSKTALLLNDLLKAPGVQYVAEKYLYISDPTPGPYVFFISPKSPHRTLNDLQQAKGLKAGGTSAKGALVTAPSVMFEILGLDGKVISGYKGSKGTQLAVTTGEVDIMVIRGNAVVAAAKAGDLIPLFTIFDERAEPYPDVPTIREFGVKIPKELEAAYSAISGGGNAVALPPGVPQDRVKYLRKVFDRLNKNEELQAQLTKQTGAPAEFISGDELQKWMTGLKSNQALGGQLAGILAKYKAAK